MHRSSSEDFTVLSRSFGPAPRFMIKTTHVGHNRITVGIPTVSSLLSTENDELEERNSSTLNLKLSGIFKKNSSMVKPLPLSDFSLNTSLTTGLEIKKYGGSNISHFLNSSIDNGKKIRGVSAPPKRRDNEIKQSSIKIPSKEIPNQFKKREVSKSSIIKTNLVSVGHIIKGRPVDLVRRMIEQQSVLDSTEDLNSSRLLQDREKMYINTSGIRKRTLNLSTERKIVKAGSSGPRYGSITSREDEYLKAHLYNGLTREKTQVQNLTLDQLKSRLLPKKALVNAYEVIGSYGPRKRQI